MQIRKKSINDKIDLMIIALKPSGYDTLTKYYLSDISGIFIDKVLDSHDINNYYITVFIKDLIEDKITKKLLHTYYEHLYNEILKVKPKIILLLGKQLINYFYENSEGINKQINIIKTINLFNPKVIGSRKKSALEIKYTDNNYNFIGTYDINDILNDGVLEANKKKASLRECLFMVKDYLNES